jgi:hypothetical protein
MGSTEFYNLINPPFNTWASLVAYDDDANMMTSDTKCFGTSTPHYAPMARPSITPSIESYSNVRQVSYHDDISTSCSHAAVRCSVDSTPTSNTMYPSTSQLIVSVDEVKLTQALKNLTESMQRSEESRRQVMMHWLMLTSEQKHALRKAKDELGY